MVAEFVFAQTSSVFPLLQFWINYTVLMLRVLLLTNIMCALLNIREFIDLSVKKLYPLQAKLFNPFSIETGSSCESIQ